MEAAEIFASTIGRLLAASDIAWAMTHRSISADESVPLRDGQEAARLDELPISPDHPKQQFLTGPAALQRHDGLGVQDEPLLIEGIADPADPGQRRELALEAGLLLLLLGGIAEDDHYPLRSGAASQRRGGVRDREDRAVLAGECVVEHADRAALVANVQQRAVLSGNRGAVGALEVDRLRASACPVAPRRSTRAFVTAAGFM